MLLKKFLLNPDLKQNVTILSVEAADGASPGNQAPPTGGVTDIFTEATQQDPRKNIGEHFKHQLSFSVFTILGLVFTKGLRSQSQIKLKF